MKKTEPVTMLPWQGVVMVVCVTAAGMLHQRAESRQPIAAHAGALRSTIASATHASDLLQTVLSLSR